MTSSSRPGPTPARSAGKASTTTIATSIPGRSRSSARIRRSGFPGAVSQRTVAWAAEHRYPYVMLATRLAPTRDSFAYYDKVAAEFGYEAGPQHRGYLWKVHVDETEEKAEEVGRKYLTGPGNIFLEGSRGDVKRHIQNLPGMIDRGRLLPTAGVRHVEESRGTGDINPE